MKKYIVIIILLVSLVLSVAYIAYDKMVLDSAVNEMINEKTENDLFDVSKLSDYKNYDGSYGEIKSFSVENYSISLSLDGKVTVCKESDCNDITNLKNVVDMIKLSVSGGAAEQEFYFLLDNGDVYGYLIGDVDNKVFEASKLEHVSNVKRIINYSYNPKQGGTEVWGIIAITDSNEYVKLV